MQPIKLMKFWRQFTVLVQRNLRLILNDKLTMASLILQAPFMVLVIKMVVDPDCFTSNLINIGSRTALFIISAMAAFMGTLNSYREICKEREIILREASVGVSLLAVVLSKAFVLLLSACARHKIIPDDTLAQIFHDAFLTNAYIGSEGVKTDSLRIYEPIFARYGYTTDDVHYTIGNFSKRKSARLGDVVERAIEMLEREGKIYNQEVAVLDTIDNVARRTFTRTVLADSLIRVGSLRDTARLSFTLDVEPGEYSLSLKYLVDSLDRNQRGLKGSVWLERRDSSRTNVYTTTLRRNREESFSRRFTTDTTHRRLRIDFLTFNARPERPSVTVTDLKVEYIPPTRTAVEKLYEQQLDIRIFADDFLRAAAIPKDSL